MQIYPVEPKNKLQFKKKTASSMERAQQARWDLNSENA